MISKNQLRKNAKEIRKSLDLKKISDNIVHNIFDSEIYKKSAHIMIFYPLKFEINLLEVLEDKAKTFYLPKVSGSNLVVCPYCKGDSTVLSQFDTQEPLTQPIDNVDMLDLVFVPALMADKTKNRLGYGGGFYDRFLSKLGKSTYKVVVIPELLLTDEIPFDSFDERVDYLITENKII